MIRSIGRSPASDSADCRKPLVADQQAALESGATALYYVETRLGLVEAAGVEPASEAASSGISTSVSRILLSPGGSS